MKTPPDLRQEASIFRWQNTRGIRQHGPEPFCPNFSSQSNLKSVSATKSRQEPAGRTRERASRRNRVDHSRCPLMGIDEYLKVGA